MNLTLALLFVMGGFVIGYAFGLGIHKLDLWERTVRSEDNKES
jgi:hypothetical protein